MPCGAPNARPVRYSSRLTQGRHSVGNALEYRRRETNAWRLDTPGIAGWTRTARADDPDKYFMVSTDGHVQEPADLWRTRIDAK